MSFCSLYIPVGVPTYHLETAKDQFDRSCRMLRSVDPDIVCPDEMLLTLDKLRAFLDGANPDLVVFQNLTFAAAVVAFAAEMTDSSSVAPKHQLKERPPKACSVLAAE